MSSKSSWKPYCAFWIFFFSQVFITNEKLLGSFLKAYVFYLLVGGWRFQRMVFLTIRRDLIGLRLLFLLHYWAHWTIWRKRTVGDMFNRVVQKRGKDQVAIFFGDDKWTFGDLNAYSNKVANFLLQSGFKRGDKLLLFMLSSPSYIGIWLGASKIGVATALVNSSLRKTPLAYSLKAVDAKGIIVGTELRKAYEEVDTSSLNFTTTGTNSTVWFIDEMASKSTDIYTDEERQVRTNSNWNLGLAMVSCSPPPELDRQMIDSRDPLLYVYTSGTTGFPKAAIITTTRYVYMTTGVHSSYFLTSSDVLYTSLPLYHTAGVICGVGQLLLHGVTIALRNKFSASQFWPDCIKYDCTVVQYIGEMCRFILAQPQQPTDKAHRVRLAYGNGLQAQLWVEFQRRFNIAQIGEFYGATESNTNIVNVDNTVGAVGFLTQIAPFLYPVHLIKMDLINNEPIRDPETGLCLVCEPNEPGQFIGKIDANNPARRFDGYVNSKESAKRILHNVFRTGDAWFSSGDLLFKDELGYIYFSDRMGDTFRWRGENVSTTEIESILLKAIPSVTCVVYGVAVPGCEGRAGMAAIILKPDQEIDELSLTDKLSDIFTDQLPSYARPVFLRFCRKLLLTSTFKLRKPDLVSAGFNPTKCNADPLYISHSSGEPGYRLIDSNVYSQLESGSVRL